MPAPTFELPNAAAAAQVFRDLQMQGAGGLSGLANRDTTAKRKAFEDAAYAGQAESINSAADLQRRAMLEGTFGSGVGSSSITLDLAGRLGQEQNDALARARREAMLAASAEDRADLASELGVANAAFGAGTTGGQAEANVALANLAREQQESQFGRNLAFQGSEGAANRSQQANLFGQDLGFRQQQLSQQESQFGRNLSFQGSENAATRALQQQLAQMGYTFQGSENAANRAFTGGENAATRALQQQLAQMGYAFQGGENALNRAFTGSENAANRAFTGGENASSRALQQQLAEMGYTFQGGENAANRAFTGTQNQATRDLQTFLANQQQSFAGTQNQANRDAELAQLLLQLDAQDQWRNDQTIVGGATAGLGGLGAILGPLLRSYLGPSS